MAIPDHNLACPGMHNMRDVSASHGKIENAPDLDQLTGIQVV